MYYSLYHILLSAIVGPALHNFVDACGRTPARTQNRPQTTSTTASPTQTATTSATVTAVARHQEKCNEEEEKEAACLHGECYALDLSGDGGNRSAFCQCPRMWEGQRCEQLSDDFFVLYAEKVKTAGIAAGVVVVILIVTVIIVYIAVKRRKRRKRNQDHRGHRERDAQMNGNATQPLMKEPVQTELDRVAVNGVKPPETNV